MQRREGESDEAYTARVDDRRAHDEWKDHFQYCRECLGTLKKPRDEQGCSTAKRLFGIWDMYHILYLRVVKRENTMRDS